jgi:hypothetical protein
MKRNSVHLQINLYKESKDFPLSGVDIPIYNEERTIKRILEVLKPLFNKTTNVVIDSSQMNHVFIKDIILFCKAEGIDYGKVMSWTVQIESRDIISIVFNKGVYEDVYTINI